MRKTLSLALVLVAAALAGCGGDDPVSYSSPVALNLKAKSTDVAADAVKAEKEVNTESGNPYGAFVADAQAQLGADPGRVEVSSLELLLGTDSTNVTELREIFNGTVDVQFEMNSTNNIYPVGHATIDDGTAGRGPLAFTVVFSSSDISQVDWDTFLGGGFKVSIAGPTAATFEGKGAEANFQLSLTFAAFAH